MAGVRNVFLPERFLTPEWHRRARHSRSWTESMSGSPTRLTLSEAEKGVRQKKELGTFLDR
jgi:hypothetical protein